MSGGSRFYAAKGVDPTLHNGGRSSNYTGPQNRNKSRDVLYLAAMKILRPGKLKANRTTGKLGAVLLLPTLLRLTLVDTAHAAVFDFTPATGTINAVYSGGASGNVQISISGANPISVPTGSTQAPLVNNGIVAWSSSSKVYYYVFDPALGQWQGDSTDIGAFAQDLSVAAGVVAWSTKSGTAGAFFRVYDPSRHAWVRSSVNGAISEPQILNRDGVVAWSTAATTSTVHFQTYDPTRNGWQPGSGGLPPGKKTFDLTTANGAVAWSVGTGITTATVSYQIYDPQTGTWKSGSNNNNATTALTITDGLVSWSTSAGNFFRGYNGPAKQWASGAPVPLAYFSASIAAGNQPLLVQFIDMSLGATSWSWDFGNGNESNLRSPTYKYTTFGRYDVTLRVNGNASSSHLTILTDVNPPTGTVQINGASSGGFTTNRSVTLTLNATDNSSVTSMRFNNDGDGWSEWESYATTRTWNLNTNDGTRTVSAQFRDLALNTSATVSASIQLDTSPLPVASVGTTNVLESAGTFTIAVTLDRTYSRPVAVGYATSNGTATAGLDFVSTAGTLTFPTGVRALTLPLTIQQDDLVELNETFSIRLIAISNVVAGASGQITIGDDEFATVSFAQANYSAIESNGAAAITVRLSAPSGRTVSVQYAATNGTATADLDYTPVTGQLNFPPGVTNQTFVIPLIDESLDEFPETVELKLFGPVNALLSPTSTSTLTILDDDKPVVFFSQAVYPVYESNGVSLLTVSVRLSKPYDAPVFVECAVQGISATPALDYDQPSSGISLNFQPNSGAGSTNKDITLIILPDTIAEPQETMRLTLRDFAGGSPGPTTTATVVITDDDAPPFMANTVLGTNGSFSATFIGFPGQIFAVECSPNFINWTQIARLTNTTGTLNYSQPIPSTPGGQFYRTRLIP